jgi:hypothetical protein
MYLGAGVQRPVVSAHVHELPAPKSLKARPRPRRSLPGSAVVPIELDPIDLSEIARDVEALRG